MPPPRLRRRTSRTSRRSRTASWATAASAPPAAAIPAGSRRSAGAAFTCTGSSAGCDVPPDRAREPAGRLPQALLETAARIAQRLDALDGGIVAIQQQARLLQDELDSRTASRVNRHLYVLSIITSLFLPPGVIAGIFGMNLAGMPLTSSPAGFLVGMPLIAGSPLLVYLALWLCGALRR